MRSILAAAVLLAGASACESRAGDGNESATVDAADTVITPRTTQDTTIVTRDTSVEVDTIRREGEVRRGSDTVAGSDTTSR